MSEEKMNKGELKIKIIEAFLEDEEMGYMYKYFEEKTGATREEIKSIMDELRRIGYVRHAKGLMDEEGFIVGSGFMLTERATQWSIREWLQKLKNIQSDLVSEKQSNDQTR